MVPSNLSTCPNVVAAPALYGIRKAEAIDFFRGSQRVLSKPSRLFLFDFNLTATVLIEQTDGTRKIFGNDTAGFIGTSNRGKNQDMVSVTYLPIRPEIALKFHEDFCLYRPEPIALVTTVGLELSTPFSFE